MTRPDLPPPPTDAEIREGSKRSWTVIAVVMALFAIVALWSGGRGVYRNYGIARSGVDQFHQRFDQTDYDSIYKDTTAAFRAAGSHDDVIKFFEGVHQRMGKSGAVTATGFHINWLNGHIVVNQRFSTEFAQGQAQEGFVWLIENDRPLLNTYHIDAPQLG